MFYANGQISLNIIFQEQVKRQSKITNSSKR